MSEPLPELPGQPAGTATEWQPPTQLDVARFLGAYSRALSEATKEADRLGREYAETKKAYRVAYATAFLADEDGPVKEREQRAALAAVDEQFAMEAKEQELKAARERVDTLKTQISTGQSIGAAIRAEMGLAGPGGTP